MAVLLTSILNTGAVAADELDSIGALSQSQFAVLAENLGAATYYRSIAPIEQLGIIGFDVSLGLTSTEIDDDVFDQASNGSSSVDTFLMPRLQVHKGLPFGLDIGASIATSPDTDFTVIGAELRYALVEGNVAVPAVGLRASYTRADGHDELDAQNLGFDIGISKGILMFTPFAGAGVVRTTLTPSNATGLEEEDVDQERVFLGVNLNFGINFTVQADRTGDYTTYSARAGLRF